MYFRDDASAAQRAADASGLIPHALVRLLHPEDRLAVGKGDAHPLPDRVRFVSRERENVAQEGFDALAHWVSLASRIALGDSARAVCSWRAAHPSTRPPKYRAAGSLTTTRGSPTAFR